MQFCNQDISKTITDSSFQLGQLIEDNEYYLVKLKKKKKNELFPCAISD